MLFPPIASSYLNIREIAIHAKINQKYIRVNNHSNYSVEAKSDQKYTFIQIQNGIDFFLYDANNNMFICKGFRVAHLRHNKPFVAVKLINIPKSKIGNCRFQEYAIHNGYVYYSVNNTTSLGFKKNGKQQKTTPKAIKNYDPYALLPMYNMNIRYQHQIVRKFCRSTYCSRKKSRKLWSETFKGIDNKCSPFCCKKCV